LKEWIRPYYMKWWYFRLKENHCPTYFKDCWGYPCARADEIVLPPQGPLPDVIFLPLADWHTRFQRSQHLAATFASLGHRCFYLNPHLGREFVNTFPRSPRVIISTLAQRVFELHVHLPREPVFHHRCLRPEENMRVVAAIETLLRTAGSRNPIVVISFPLWASVAADLRRRFGARVIYDCHDLLSGFGNIAPDILAHEDELFRESDLVCFSAQSLMDQMAPGRPGLHGRSVVIRNAVDYCDFAPSEARQSQRNGRKTIGYVGSLSAWVDTRALRQLAVEHPEWRLVLIGRVESGEVEKLRSLPNVALPGEVKYAEVPRRLSEFDVALIPFLKTPLTIATNPIKLYEYFAQGLPVVSTRLPETEQFGPLVYMADSADQFVQQVELALAEEGDSAPVNCGMRPGSNARCAPLACED
jgi:glycosyltransferase involved in cell wall biosynthesis